MRISDWSSDVCSSDLPAPAPGPGALYGPTGPQAYQRPDGAATAQKGASGLGGPPEVKLVSFAGGQGGTASRVEKGNTLYTDSINYLPPNSFARAKVIVGVDASAGVNSQIGRASCRERVWQ